MTCERIFGFNGKEADTQGEWGSATHYDYGFRIYNPSIGKFLSVDPLSPDYPWYTPYQFAGNKPIIAIDLDGLEELTVFDMWTRPESILKLQPVLQLTEWTRQDRQKFSSGFSVNAHTNSFSQASYYNTIHNNPKVYRTVAERHAYYLFADGIINAHSSTDNVRWFKAAAIVTGITAVGGTEMQDFGLVTSNDTDRFLQAGNEFLFSHNLDNARSLVIAGAIEKVFTDANGEVIDLSTLSGVNLDYAMVQYEQTLVEEFSTSYFMENPDADRSSIVSQVNAAFDSPLGSSLVKSVIKENFTDNGESFDFNNYDHRVTLGQKLVDKIREDE